MTWKLVRAQALAGVALIALVLVLGACDQKGKPCDHAGDVRASSGNTYVCTRRGDQLVWASDAVPGAGVHTMPAPRAVPDGS
jgi:hypothetical protein